MDFMKRERMRKKKVLGSIFVCHVCDEPAQLFCPSCKKYYCEECGAAVHKKRLKRGHELEAIKKAPPRDDPEKSERKPASSSDRAIASGNEKHACEKLEFFCLDDNDVFCRACSEEKHKGHPVIRLEEALRNFSIGKYIKAFGEAFKATKNLSVSIDNEVERLLDNIAEVRSVISSSFDKLRAALDEEEYMLLTQLETESSCTENLLTEVYQSITEQIEKCQPLIDKFIIKKQIDNNINDDGNDPEGDDDDDDDSKYKSGDNNIINSKDDKVTDVNPDEITEMFVNVQKMERAIEEMRRLRLIPLTRLSAKYDESKRKIQFERFAFSGLQVPRELTFSDVGCSSVCVSWRVCNVLNASKDGIQYRLEMKAEAPNRTSDYKVVYEGPECSCKMDNLVRGWIYTFRVCCTLDKCHGGWSAEKSVRTKNIKLESNILQHENPMFPVHISEWCKAKHFELLYRASSDGMTAADFHKKCDNQGPTVTIVRSANGCVFGGFASVSWGKDGKGHKAPGSFLFTLKNLHGIAPTYFPLKDRMDGNAVFHYSNCGVAFGKGADFIMYSPFDVKNKSHTDFVTYQDSTGKGYAALSGDRNFVASEVEVFKIIRSQRN